jgi:fumarate hydratase class II
MTMVCARVFGNQTTMSFAGSQGHLELNVFKPVLAFALLETISLLADACQSFRVNCVEGITANRERISDLLSRSLMLVTALAPRIGYDKAAKVAKTAHEKGTTLREEAVALGYVTAEEFDAIVRPEAMLAPDA